jgi:hypothetical protein
MEASMERSRRMMELQRKKMKSGLTSGEAAELKRLNEEIFGSF